MGNTVTFILKNTHRCCSVYLQLFLGKKHTHTQRDKSNQCCSMLSSKISSAVLVHNSLCHVRKCTQCQSV